MASCEIVGYGEDRGARQPRPPRPATRRISSRGLRVPRGGPPGEATRREIVDAIRYVRRHRMQVEEPAPRLPPWRTCYNFMARWAAAGVIEQVRGQLRKHIRCEMSRATARSPPSSTPSPPKPPKPSGVRRSRDV
ncbi:transposase [Streptomyces sp. NPDC002755]